MKFSTIFILSLTVNLFTGPAFPQQPSILWQSFYNGSLNDVDYFKDMVQDPNGNTYVVCGTKGNISGYDQDITTYKINTSGAVEWSDYLSGSGSNSLDYPIDIVYDPNGAVISLGNTKEPGVVVIKYSLTGQRQWVYFSPSEYDEAHSITVDNSGYIYIAGQTRVPNTGNYSALLIKLSPSGSQVFRNLYKYGGTIDAWVAKFISMINDQNGDLILVGDCRRTSTNHYSALVAKINTSGTEIWNHIHYSDSVYTGSFRKADLCIDGDNNIYAVSPASKGENDYADFLVFRLDNSTGNATWIKKMDGGNGGTDNVKSILPDNFGNIYLSGYSRYFGPRFSHVLIKMKASNGDLVWEKEIRDYGTAGNVKYTYNDFCLDDMGNFYISLPEVITDLKKFNSDGDTLWTKDILGAFRGNNGGYNWIDVYFSTVIKAPDGKIYIGCSGTPTGNYGPSDVMVACLSEGTSDVNKDSEEFPLQFNLAQNYPNPFNPTTNIGFRIAEGGFVSLKVYDVLGNEVAILVNEEKPAGGYDVEFEASKLKSGVYFYRLSTGEYNETKKMILLR